MYTLRMVGVRTGICFGKMKNCNSKLKFRPILMFLNHIKCILWKPIPLMFVRIQYHILGFSYIKSLGQLLDKYEKRLYEIIYMTDYAACGHMGPKCSN